MVKTFKELGLGDELISILEKMLVFKPLSFQADMFNYFESKTNTLMEAPSGEGKTLSYILPAIKHVLELGPFKAKRTPRYIILAPTKEILLQVDRILNQLKQAGHFSHLCFFGGKGSLKNSERLLRGIDFLLCTPKSLSEFVSKEMLLLDRCEGVILDEADRLLKGDFSLEISESLENLSKDIPVYFFSAGEMKVEETLFSARTFHQLKTTEKENQVEASWYKVEKDHKLWLARKLLRSKKIKQALVFINSKNKCEELTQYFIDNKIKADFITGDKSLDERKRSLTKLKDGIIKCLVCTDVIGRGVDIKTLDCVLNFDFPLEYDSFLQRAGRVARKGQKGKTLYNFVLNKELDRANDFSKSYGLSIEWSVNG